MRLIDADELRIKPEYMHDICGVAMIRVEDVARIITEMPTVAPQPQWIPVSKRLPSPTGYVPYLVTNAHYEPSYKGRQVVIDWYDSRDESIAPTWENHREGNGVRVVAWQPLPEPYKGE